MLPPCIDPFACAIFWCTDVLKFISKARPLVQVCGTMPVEKKLHWTSFKEEKKAPDAGKKKKKKKKKK